MDEKFLRAVEKTLGHEGGYSNDPADPGGETKWGISKAAYPNLDIASLTREDAIEIYYRDYWQPAGCDEIEDEAVVVKLFDIAVNMGVEGAKTRLAEARADTEPELLSKLRLACIRKRIARVEKKPSQQKYFRGWVIRDAS